VRPLERLFSSTTSDAVSPNTARGRREAGRQGGQALVELALASIVLLLLLMAIVDFGLLFSDKLAMSNAARGGARWASKHPTSWSSATTPDSNTIEGQVQAAGGVVSVPNNDSHLTIAYYDVTSGTPVLCGSYSASSSSFVAASGYTQSTCVIPGTMVQVTITYTYPLLTPVLASLYPGGVTVNASAAFVEET
jgi:Flp pilus assembly protein TadG